MTSVLSGLATAALVVLLPRAVGATWGEVGAVLGRVSAGAVVVLAVVWIAGLWAHSFVLAASLPGLTKRRGLTLSLTGSAVSNVLPLGGAAGTGLNFAMVRRWGFSRSAFGGFLAVTTLLNMISKLGVIAVALALVPILHSASVFGAASLVFLPVPLAVVAVVWMLADERVAAGIGAALDKILRRKPGRLAGKIPELRRSILRVMRNGWRPMTAGMLAYLALQLALLWLCFHVLGISFALPVLFTALAVERLLTLVADHPGRSRRGRGGHRRRAGRPRRRPGRRRGRAHPVPRLHLRHGDPGRRHHAGDLVRHPAPDPGPLGRAGGGRRMRIALVSDCYLPRLGGIELQVHDLAGQLIRAGHQVTVFTVTDGPPAAGDVPVVRLPALGGVPLPAATDRLRRALDNGRRRARPHVPGLATRLARGAASHRPP